MSAAMVITLMLIVILGTIFEAILANNYNISIIATPNDFYENTKMNWFGCWFCYILIRVFSPIVTVIGSVVLAICAILTFIEWLFTVGRKDEDVN